MIVRALLTASLWRRCSVARQPRRPYVFLLDEQDRKPRRPDLMKGRDDLPHDKSKTTRRFLAWPPLNELTRAEQERLGPYNERD